VASRTLNPRSLAFLFSTICALVALFAFAGAAGAATRSGGTGTDPWIASELPDYAPGATVSLIGGSWQPGEPVHINVDDADGHTWTRDVDVTADSSGDINDSFALPDWFVTNYNVTATGATSGTATTHFTDAAVQTTTTLVSSTNPSDLGQSVTFTATVTCDSACVFDSVHHVDFYDGGGASCNGTLLAGNVALTGSGSITRQAVFSTSSLSSGTHTVRACFNGGGPGDSPKSSVSSPLSQVVRVGPPAKVAFTAQPTDAIIDNLISPAVQVAVQDASGSTVTTSSASITIALGANPGSATLSGSTTVNAVNGVATFSALSLDRSANGYTLSASSSGLTSATSGTFNITKRTTSTSFSCTPSTVGIGNTTSCTATVSDTSPGVTSAPTGTVQWTLPSGVTGPTSCTLSGSGASSSCSVTLTVTTSGNKTISGISYNLGDTKHSSSSAANFVINVVPTGTMTVDRTSVTAGTTNSFAFTFTASQAFAGGARVKLDVPAGWTAPTTGNTTVTNTSCGGTLTRTISGQSVTVTMGSGCGLGNKFTITYSSATAPATTGDYTFTTSTALSSGSFAEIATSPTVTVTPACTVPSISSQPVDQSITYGANASFTAAASGSPAPSVKWQVDSGSGFADMTPAQTNATLTLTKPAVSLSGNGYRAVFTNSCGSATSNSATLSVAAKNLTISGAAANNRTYDGNAIATVNFGTATLVGIEPGDTVTINSTGYSANFANKNVGTSKAVTVSGVTLGGTSAANYTVSQPSGLTANIGARDLTVSATGVNKVYDGTTDATVTLSTDKLSADTVSVAYTGASFASKHVGNGKAVSVSGISISGADAGNYHLTNTTASTSADITARPITVKAATDSKVYDGTTGSTATPTITSGTLASGDTSGFSQAFGTRTVGSGKTLIPSGSVVDGNSGNNYNVSFQNDTTGAITAKNLTTTGAVANDKEYNGTATATVNFSAASLNGKVTGDVVSIDSSGYSASFVNKNVGTSKPVTVTGVALSGGDSGNYTVSQPSGLTADITAKELSVGFEAQNKTYDGNTVATIKSSPAPSLVGVVSGDAVLLDGSGASASFGNKNVGTGKTVTASGFAKSGADAGNYVFASPQGTTSADISAKELSVGFEAQNKTYDGNTVATIKLSPAPSLVGVVSGDTVNLDGSAATASFGNKTVGTGKIVTASGFSKGGADAGNYVFASPQGTTSADISAKILTIAGAVANDKVYDGDAAATVTWSGASLVGVVSGDTVSIDHIGYSASFANKNVGTGKPVTVTGVALSGGDAPNYSVSQPSGLTANIGAKNLTISGASANNKTYDGTTSATVDWTGASLNGVVSGETVSIDHSGYSASFANKNVGTNKAVTVVGVVLGGSDAGNYTVSQPSGLTANISVRDLTVSASGVNKTYDGTADATVMLSTDKLTGDTVSAAYTSASFANKHVGTGKTVSVSGISISGGEAGNYHLTNTTASTSADIDQRPITVGAVTDSKVYDGTTSSSGTPTVMLGSIASGDTANFSQAFGSRTVGTGKTLISSGSVIDGNGGDNYDVTFENDTTGVISAKNLTISGAIANDKVYDGNNAATVTWSGASLVGVAGSDDVSIDHSGYSASFANKNVGTGKPVTVTGVALSGGDATNYSVSQPSGLSANITAKSLSVSFEAQNKTYDGNTVATIKASPAASLVGKVSGDDVVLDGSGASASFANKNVGTGKTVTASGFTKSGTDAGNYVFTTPQGTTTADISAKELSVSFEAQNKTYDGNDTATIKLSPAPSLVGKVVGDDVSLGSGSASAHFGDKNVGTGKTVTGSGFTKSGADSGNYVFTTPQGTTTADISAKGLIIDGAVANNKVYDGYSTATVDFSGATLNGVVGSDDVSIDHSGYSASFANKNVGNNKPVVVTGVALSGGDSTNYTVSQPSGLTANISAKNLTISGASAVDKTYDATTSATIDWAGASLNGVVSGDTVTIDHSGYVASFATKHVGTNKAVTVVGVVLGGSDASNYTVSQPSGLTASISQARLDIYAVSQTKTYDGTTNSSATPTLGSGQVKGTDTVDGLVQRFQSKNVLGTGNSTLEVSAYSIHDGNSGGNYDVHPHTASGTITKATLDINAVSDSKIYDGTTSSIQAPTYSAGQLKADDTVDGLTQAFHSKNVMGPGGSTLDVTGYSVHDSNTGGNYDVHTHTASGTISAKNLTISGAAANNKTYDATDTATVDWAGATLNGVESGDTVSIDHAAYAAHFNNKNVGTDKPVSVTGVGLSGGDSGNYSVSQPSGLKANLSQADLDINAVSDSKTYDGTVSSTGNPTVSGLQGSTDSVTGRAQRFQSKNVMGTNGSTLEVSAYAVNDGNAGGNYAVHTHTASGTISPKNLTISGASATNKTYDANDNATVNWSGASLNGVVSGDTVSINHSAYDAHFNSRNVGTGKAVTVTGITLSGSDSGNYTVSQPSGLTANISQARLDISAASDSKTYDATTASSGTPTYTATQLQGSDTVSGLAQRFQTRHVLGTGNSVLEVSAYTVNDGNSGANYDVHTQTAAGTITRAALDINAVTDTKVYDGTTSSSVTPTVSGLQGSDTVSPRTQRFQSKNVLGAGNSTLEVSAYTVNDGNSGGNYTVATHTASGTITKRTLDINAVTDTKVYDGNTGSTPTPTLGVGQLQTGDSVAGRAQRFQSKNVMGTNGSTLLVSAYTVNDGNAGGNYDVHTNTATGTITKKNLTVSGITANNKPWDGNTSATLNVGGAAVVGVVTGDAVTLNTGAAVGTFGSPNVGPQTVTISGLTISGVDNGNYNLIQPTTAATIGAWNAAGYGFYAPVGVTNSIFTAAPATAPANNPGEYWNTAKGGSTIPLKFNVYAGSVEKTNLSDITGFSTYVLTACAGGSGEDQVDFTTTGNTSLRYDGSAGQWIQNWKTPNVSGDTCYRTIVRFADNSSIEAFFKLRR
jgi:hypothetical protein